MQSKTHPISIVLRAKHSVGSSAYVPVNGYIAIAFSFQRFTSFILWVCATIRNPHNRQIYPTFYIHDYGSRILFRQPKINTVWVVQLIQHAPFCWIFKLKSKTAVLESFPFINYRILNCGSDRFGLGRRWRYCRCLNRSLCWLLSNWSQLFNKSKIPTNSGNGYNYHNQNNIHKSFLIHMFNYSKVNN